MKLVSQLQSTGENRVQSTKLKTRVNVVHAGLSRLLLRWKVWPPSRRRNSLIFLNNNLLIVTAHLMVAKEDTHTMHSNTTRRIRQISKKTTPTKQQMEPAGPLALQVRLASPRSLLSRPRVGGNFWPPLPSVPSPWRLMLGSPLSKCTQAVSSMTPAVCNKWTTLSLLLVMVFKKVKNITLLETLGALHGVTEVTSKLHIKIQALVSVVLRLINLSTQSSSEKLKKNSSNCVIIYKSF